MGPLRICLAMCIATPLLALCRAVKGPSYAKETAPTQFELAMFQTMEEVRAGTAPDPAARRPDGTPGTLLDALLPEGLRNEAREHRRRQLGNAASWRFFGANIRFSTGPSVAALNSSFYRYASVSPPSYVDWRNTKYITPILAQYDCASCWAMAAADTVAMATAIATGKTAAAPGVQQICDCSGMGCCQGGWPEDAFAWMVATGNITTAANYNYWAQDGRTCTVKQGYSTAGNITGWERVPIYSQNALMQAVSMQPVLIYVSAATKDFQQYTSTAPGTSGFVIYDGNCTTEVNHAMVVVGYNTQGTINYWILKNSWPSFGWGDNGYMYLRMTDGPGKCGMQTVNPIFPTYFPNAPVQLTVQFGSYSPVLYDGDYWWNWWSYSSWYNPCSGIINPCGGGSCYSVGGIARCSCPYPYVEITGVPTSKCVDPSPCTSGLFSPCGVGTCMDVGDGSYICGCPSGYAIGSRTNGAPTCIPVSSLGIKTSTYVVQYGDTCAKIQSAFSLTSSAFAALNPYLSCSRMLVPGIVINLAPASGIICNQLYAIRSYDTCGEIAYYMDQSSFVSWLNPAYWGTSTPTELYTVPQLSGPSWYSTSSLMKLNPALNCSSLFLSQQVCVNSTTSTSSATPTLCGQTYVTVEGDSCYSIRQAFAMNKTYFTKLNPALNCNYNNGYFYSGVQICVAPTPSAVTINCSQWYTVQQGDTCAQIWNGANVSQSQLLYINPGLQCQPPFLYVGLQICIDSPVLANLSDPSYQVYTVQAGDTWSSVQSQFTNKCKASSITIPKIALQNSITNWVNYTLTPGLSIIIPCVPKVGATCGCATSLPVCGNNFVNYASYCDARCNFATPVTSGSCSACQNACQGRYGDLPVPTSACAANYICPWPAWPPPTSDATAVFTTSPLCNYRSQTCKGACVIYNNVMGYASTDTYCYNTCMACQRVPCSGPSEIVDPGSFYCPTCTSTGCAWASGGMCATVCTYWNSYWNPLNP